MSTKAWQRCTRHADARGASMLKEAQRSASGVHRCQYALRGRRKQYGAEKSARRTAPALRTRHAREGSPARACYRFARTRPQCQSVATSRRSTVFRCRRNRRWWGRQWYSVAHKRVCAPRHGNAMVQRQWQAQWPHKGRRYLPCATAPAAAGCTLLAQPAHVPVGDSAAGEDNPGERARHAEHENAVLPRLYDKPAVMRRHASARRVPAGAAAPWPAVVLHAQTFAHQPAPAAGRHPKPVPSVRGYACPAAAAAVCCPATSGDRRAVER